MFQEMNEVRLDKGTQESIVISLGSSLEILEYAYTHLSDEDFNWSVTRVVVAVLFRHFGKYKSLPSMQVLALGVKDALRGKSGIFVDVPETEHRHVIGLMKAINSSRARGTCDEKWAKDAIQSYLKQMRLYQFSAKLGAVISTGVGVEEALKDASNLAKGVSQDADDAPKLEEMFDSSVLAKSSMDLRHISTGLHEMDATMAGGPMPGELGLLIACQGVGKTNVMLNICETAIKNGLYCLFISAEMPKNRLVQRVFSMAAFINGVRFRTTGTDEFEEEEKKRIKLVEENFSGGRFQCLDFSAATLTYDLLVENCLKWHDWLVENNLKDKAGFICIDYLDLIDFSSNAGGKARKIDPEVLAELLKQFRRDVISKHDLTGIVAAQATGAAEGKQVLNRTDVAWSYHANDAVHFSFGVADEDNRMEKMANIGEGESLVDDSDDVTKHGKVLSFSFFKSRDGGKPVFRAYQSPTFRIYKTKRDYGVFKDAIDNGLYEQLLGKA